MRYVQKSKSKIYSPYIFIGIFFSATPFLGKRAGVDEALPIIAGVIGAIAALVLIGLVCLCLIQWNTKKRREFIN